MFCTATGNVGNSLNQDSDTITVSWKEASELGIRVCATYYICAKKLILTLLIFSLN